VPSVCGGQACEAADGEGVGEAGQCRHGGDPDGEIAPSASVAAVLLGAGTAAVYPTLLAAVSDVAHPAWRARAVGIYRLWRDGGFAVGALLAGVIADLVGLRAAVWAVASLTAASGLLAWARMYETRPRT
jgi:MFS family permease